MTEYDNEFIKHLDFEFVEIGDFEINIEKGEIAIKVYNLRFFSDHPHSEIEESDEHIITFSGVSKSERRISKYRRGDPTIDDFEPTETFTDYGSTNLTSMVKRFIIQGVLRNPPAWIGWDIDAVTYNVAIS